MKNFTFILLFTAFLGFCISSDLLAQGDIKGRVMESETSEAAFATVAVLNVTDSVMVKGALPMRKGIIPLDKCQVAGI